MALMAFSYSEAYFHPTIDLSSFGLEEFKQPEFESYGPKASKSVCVDTSNETSPFSQTIKNMMEDLLLLQAVLKEGNLVRGLPLKIFENDYTFVACQKGKHHKASSKKDETSRILKDFITGIKNQLNHKVKIIRCDIETEFKNYEMNQFRGIKWIKREFSNARTSQENKVAKRKNRTLIEATRTMLVDSLLPIPFCAKAVNIACYVQNKIMAASAITISSDSSDESVGSPPSWVILFGDIPSVIPFTYVITLETSAIARVISFVAPVVETNIVASPTRLCGLIPYSDSNSDSPYEMASPEYITPLPATSPFLFIDSSEDSDPSEASDSSEAPPSQDPYVTTIARWRSRVKTRSSSPSDFPIAPVTAPPGTRR
nr:hypothetical protein [Tanacetum cinerariifolium]